MLISISQKEFTFENFMFKNAVILQKVFGVIHLAIFISGPLFGKYMHILGVRKVYFFGVFLTALCAVSFGFLSKFEQRVIFVPSSDKRISPLSVKQDNVI